MNIPENFETDTGYIINVENISSMAYNDLKSKLSTIEFKTEAEIPRAFIEDKGHIFIPKINISLLNFIVKKTLVFKRIHIDIIPSTERYKLKPGWSLQPHQVDIVNEGSRHLLTSNDKRLCVCLAPGLGKTFCTSAILEKLQTKFIFLVYSSKILKQSIKAMKEHIGGKNFYVLESSSSFDSISHNNIDGLFMTHAMFKIVVKQFGIDKVNNILFKEMGITSVVFDEFDREISSTYLIQAMMPFKYSIYLTGTKFKSLKPDDRLFQLIFRSVKTMGQDVRLPPNKDALFVHFNSNPSRKEYMELMRNESMFKIHYNNILANKDVLVDFIMDKFYYCKTDTDEKNNKKLFKKMLEENGQIQFFVGRIENCESLKRRLIERYGIDENDIGVYNSAVSTKEKNNSIDKPFLISISASLGRGVDSKKVRAIVLLEFHFSLPELTQIINRVNY